MNISTRPLGIESAGQCDGVFRAHEAVAGDVAVSEVAAPTFDAASLRLPFRLEIV
jgi:hypothetical protein